MVQWRLIVADKVEGVVRRNVSTIKLRSWGLRLEGWRLDLACCQGCFWICRRSESVAEILIIALKGKSPTWLKLWFSHLVETLRLILRFFHEDDNVVQLLLGLFWSYLISTSWRQWRVVCLLATLSMFDRSARKHRYIIEAAAVPVDAVELRQLGPFRLLCFIDNSLPYFPSGLSWFGRLHNLPNSCCGIQGNTSSTCQTGKPKRWSLNVCSYMVAQLDFSPEIQVL